MIQSMTGFGKSFLQLPNKKITVEIKSLNSKGLDLNARTPSVYRELELRLRNQISQALERGKIDFSLYVEVSSEETSSKINVPVVKAYMKQLKEIHSNCEEVELLKIAIRMPDILKTEREEINEEEQIQIIQVVTEALQNLISFRKNEGASLQTELELRISNIEKLMNAAVAYDEERINTIKTRLKTALDELQTTVDTNRFEQELIYYLEKYDITEEKVRLTNHLKYFLETINEADSNGKKLGFITQEMGREINTMGSKSNHSEMQKVVVMMKDELEKIKEQVLNIL